MITVFMQFLVYKRNKFTKNFICIMVNYKERVYGGSSDERTKNIWLESILDGWVQLCQNPPSITLLRIWNLGILSFEFKRR